MKKLYCLIAGFAFLVTTNYVSAQNIFLKALPLTNGASQQRDYTDYANISSMQFGFAAETSYLKGSGASVGKPVPSEITITKNVDVSSNKFLNKLISGSAIDLVEIVTLSRIDSDNSKLMVMHKIELKDAFVTDISSSNVQGCPDGCPGIAESYKLVYKVIRITTYSVDGRGSLIPNVYVYNVARQNNVWE